MPTPIPSAIRPAMKPKKPRRAPLPAKPDFPLKTERLALRPLAPEDADAIHRLVNDWEVVRMLSRLPFPYPRALTDEWIASTAAEARLSIETLARRLSIGRLASAQLAARAAASVATPWPQKRRPTQ